MYDNSYELAKKSSFKGIADDIVRKALNNIYNKKVDIKKDIEPNIYKATKEVFDDIVDNAFGRTEFGDINFDFVNELKHNNSVFAAFRTHRQQNDIAKQLLDSNNRIKPFAQFEKDVQPLTGKYNKSWLKTEADTAVIRARQAAIFKKHEEDADLFPNFKWLPSTSPHPRETHRAFYGMVFAGNDSFLQHNFPGNEWNCKCRITSTDEEPTNKKVKAASDAPPGLDENPAFSGAIYSKSHPYFTNTYPGADKAVNTLLNNGYKSVKEYKNGGKVLIHELVNKKDPDYKDLYNVSNFFAKDGKIAKILPKLHYKDVKYNEIYGNLKGSKYEGKCPDIEVNGNFIEYESFKRPFTAKKISRMLSHGIKQSNKLILDNRKGASIRYIKKIIEDRIRIGQRIDEVWIYEKGGKLTLIK